MPAKSVQFTVPVLPVPAERMLNASVVFPVPLELTAPRVTTLCPARDGIPEISPVMELTVNPEGNPVAVYELGVLVPAI